ncbi:MAG TPA: amino acid ABC transporter permease [Kouleothrix sp.]|jgi:polar amino acid transport system permease protein|nr:amino acid ABC transporter permease [Kouleothrix sp.]
MAQVTPTASARQGRALNTQTLNNLPWWLIIILLVGAYVIYSMLQEEKYVQALTYLLQGIGLTVIISVVAYAIALVIGLIAGLGRVAKNPILFTLATLYVEVLRGIPLLVIIIYFQFVVAPSLGFNRTPEIAGTLALAACYGAYLAEVYRAGIQSIDRGQREAARSLGMSHYQMMRYIVLPQAIRRVIPALANDFIALLKDSSLLSAIAINELTQLARIQGARTFDFFRALNAAAILYLMLTLVLSLGVRWVERKTSNERA